MSEINERVVPHSKEAERSVLGAAMLDEDAYYDISEYIKPGDFYYKNHREIWEAISELVQERTPADYLTVCEQLKKRGSLDLVGGAVYVAELTADVPSTSNAGAYGKIIRTLGNFSAPAISELNNPLVFPGCFFSKNKISGFFSMIFNNT